MPRGACATVKSLQGERLESAEVDTEGLKGDRRFAIYDLDTGLGLTARRVPELLFASARFIGDDEVQITLPDGSEAVDDNALSLWLGRPVALKSARAGENGARNPSTSARRGHERLGPSWGEGAFTTPRRSGCAGSKATVRDWDRSAFAPTSLRR